VAAEVDEHHVLGPVLGGGEQPLGVARARARRAGDRVERRRAAIPLDERLRRGADERDPVQLEQEQVRRRVDAAQLAVEGHRRDVRPPLGPLREDDLEGVAAADVVAARLHAADVTVRVRQPPHPAAACRRRPGRLRDRAREQGGDLAGVAREHVRAAAGVVEAHEHVGDDEAALRQTGPVVRQRHGRLEHRHVVVAEVADDRSGGPLRLPEGDEPVAAADERVPAEPALLDRLEQERRPPVRAQVEVGRERRQQVGVERCGRVHETRNDPCGSSGRAETGCRSRGYARGLPPRSRRQAQVVRVESFIAVSVAASCLNAQAVAVPPVLSALLDAPGPSGHEEAAAAVWREAASAFAEVTSDTLGNSFARVRAGDGAPTFAVLGHIDEIGVLVSNVEDDGLLSFVTIGGISPEPLLGSRIELLARSGPVPGTIARRRLQREQLKDRPRLELADLHIDIGAASRAAAEALVRIGDAGTWVEPAVELPGNRLLSKGLDNRLGAYVALEAARRVAEDGGARVDVVAVAVDVTPSTDTPGGDPRRAGRIELGAGAMIARGPILNRHVTDLLAEVAEREGIAHALEAASSQTNTDADDVHHARAGVPTGLLSIPTRYLHTPSELCSLDDVEATVRLVTAFALALERDHSFLR